MAEWAWFIRPRTLGCAAFFVALKFLPPEVARDPHALIRFQREAQAASALNHPDVSTIHDIGEQDGQSFIAMEFLDGVTLKHRIDGRAMPQGLLLTLGNRDRRRARSGACKGHHPIATSSLPTFSSPAAGSLQNLGFRSSKGLREIPSEEAR